jgi:hypothetical protein
MTDWEQHYLEGNTPWNKNQPSPPMLEWVRQNKPAGRALVPGCGVGHDVAMLCEHGLDACGLDRHFRHVDKVFRDLGIG